MELSAKEVSKIVNLLELMTVDVPLLVGKDITGNDNYMKLIRKAGLVNEEGYITPEAADEIYGRAYDELVRLAEERREKDDD